VVRSAGPSISSTINALDAQTITSAGQNAQVASPWYSDQILPFDITLSGANEYGAMCGAKIFGVEILNEGWGISIDDAVSEMQATFVARMVEPMSAIASPFQIEPGLSVLPATKNPRTRAGGKAAGQGTFLYSPGLSQGLFAHDQAFFLSLLYPSVTASQTYFGFL
jgi:hypothetical protein